MRRMQRMAAALFAGALVVAAAASLSTASIAAPTGPKTLKVWLAPAGADANAWGKARYTFTKKFSRLQVVTHNLALGTYNVEVGGALVGSFDVRANRRTGMKVGKFVMDSRQAGLVMLDPRGVSLEVVAQGTGAPVLAADRFPASALEQTSSTGLEAHFENTGVQPTARGEAEFKDREGRMKFKVEVEGLTPGAYDLIVGGVAQGQLQVGSDGEGELSFDSVPVGADDDDQGEDDQGEDGQGGDDQGDDDQGDTVGADESGGDGEDGDGDLLLTFDPRGLDVLISLEGVTVLQIVPFPAG